MHPVCIRHSNQPYFIEKQNDNKTVNVANFSSNIGRRIEQMQNLIFFKLVCSLLPDAFILCFFWTKK